MANGNQLLVEIKNTEVFKTDIKQIFDFLQCAKDKERLKELIEKDSAYQQMEEEAYDMIAAFTNEEMYISIKDRCKKEGKVDMCQALRELMEDSKLVGMEEGIEKGMEKGIEKGIEVNYTPQNGHDKKKGSLKMDTRKMDRIP